MYNCAFQITEAEGRNGVVINIQDDLLKIHKLGLLDKLLADKTTKKNIMWATNAYCSFGARYERNEAITPDLIITIK